MKGSTGAVTKHATPPEKPGEKRYPAEELAEQLCSLRQLAEQQLSGISTSSSAAPQTQIARARELVERVSACEKRFLAFWGSVVEFMLDKGIQRVIDMELAFRELQRAIADVEKLIPSATRGRDERAACLAPVRTFKETLSRYRSHLARIIENRFLAETDPNTAD